MKRFLTVTGAVVALACPAALAQSPAPAQQTAPPPAQGEAAPAQPQQRAIHPMLAALQGMQVAVLQNSEGGVASVQSQSGTKAIVVFMTPAAAEAELQSVEDDDMRVGIVDLASILAGWDGAVIFRSSPQEIQNAEMLDPETEDFMAPVFLVMSGEMEAQLQTENGRITPILTGYANAEQLAANLGNSDAASDEIKIVPIELATLLQAIKEYGQDAGYRFFSHPETVAAIQASRQAAPQDGTPAPQQ